MKGLEDLVERRIRNAIDAGEFDNLPGSGSPLDLADDVLVPEEMRLAYRVLKNAGYVPEEVALRKEIAGVERLLDEVLDGEHRRSASRRLALLRLRLAACRGDRPLDVDERYQERLRGRLSGDS